MHEAAFAMAAAPAPVRILNLPLRRYAIGHELLLTRENNSLIGAGHVIEAVWLCANTWQENLNTYRDPWVRIKLWLWRRRWHGKDLAPAMLAFRAYRDAGSGFPPCSSGDAPGGRSSGAPLLARLISFLIREFRMSETQAMNYPLGLAQWHYATWLEREGCLKIPNAAESEFEDYCAEEDRKKELEALGHA